jgi:hypothetical protein
MKITISGKTPMERLTNLTKRVISVPKSDIESEERKWRKAQRAKRTRRR